MHPTGAENTMKMDQFCNNSATTEQSLFLQTLVQRFPNNVLIGGADDNIPSAGSGDDQLEGGVGNDTVMALMSFSVSSSVSVARQKRWPK